MLYLLHYLWARKFLDLSRFGRAAADSWDMAKLSLGVSMLLGVYWFFFLGPLLSLPDVYAGVMPVDLKVAMNGSGYEAGF